VLAHSADIGVPSHGYEALPLYLRRLEHGGIRPCAPSVLLDGNQVRVDANRGPGAPALRRALEALADVVESDSIGMACIENNNHIGAVGAYWQFVDWSRIQVILILGLASRQLVPPWSVRPSLGSNAISFMARHDGGEPLVIDFGTGAMSIGQARMLKATGQTAPAACVVDREGLPTSSVEDIDEGGGVRTFGGMRGAFISLMIEILAGAVGGGGSSARVVNQVAEPGKCMNSSQLVIALGNRAGHPLAPGLEEIIRTNFGYPAAEMTATSLIHRPSGRQAVRRCDEGRLEILLTPESFRCLFPSER
jgi:delta1-piperideine-2-carboxylate reductase